MKKIGLFIISFLFFFNAHAENIIPKIQKVTPTGDLVQIRDVSTSLGNMSTNDGLVACYYVHFKDPELRGASAFYTHLEGMGELKRVTSEGIDICLREEKGIVSLKLENKGKKFSFHYLIHFNQNSPTFLVSNDCIKADAQLEGEAKSKSFFVAGLFCDELTDENGTSKLQYKLRTSSDPEVQVLPKFIGQLSPAEEVQLELQKKGKKVGSAKVSWKKGVPEVLAKEKDPESEDDLGKPQDTGIFAYGGIAYHSHKNTFPLASTSNTLLSAIQARVMLDGLYDTTFLGEKNRFHFNASGDFLAFDVAQEVKASISLQKNFFESSNGRIGRLGVGVQTVRLLGGDAYGFKDSYSPLFEFSFDKPASSSLLFVYSPFVQYAIEPQSALFKAQALFPVQWFHKNLKFGFEAQWASLASKVTGSSFEYSGLGFAIMLGMHLGESK